MASALLSGEISQYFSDYAAKFEPMTRAGRRNGDLRVLRMGTNDEVFIRCRGVPIQRKINAHDSHYIAIYLTTAR